MVARLDFRKLRYVVTAAETHSLTAAARQLSITQPALTRCIAEVEEQLETQLFLRLPRGVTVTPEGEKFVNRARVLLEDLDALCEDSQLGSRITYRRLRLGVAPGPYLTLAAGSLADFAADNPDVDITTTEGRPQEVIPMLETGEVDLVLTTTTYMDRWPEAVVEHIAPLQFAYMVRKGHPAEQYDDLSRDDMQRYPAILPATSDWLLQDIAVLQQERGLPPFKATYKTDDYNLIFSLVNRTNAYFPIVTISSSISELSKRFSMINVITPSPNQHLCLAFSKARAISPLVKLFVPIIKDKLGD